MKKYILIGLVLSVSLQGCMMGGMGMMHGGDNENMEMANHTTMIIKEFNTAQYKITAEFPSMVMSNAENCNLKIFDKIESKVQTDASVYLEVAKVDSETNDYGVQVASSFESKPMGIKNDYFVFKPDLSAVGKYQLTFKIKRIGSNTFSDPISIEAVIENHPDMKQDRANSNSGSIFTSPYFYVGTLAMALMMVFMIF